MDAIDLMLPLLPLRDMVIFPSMVAPLFVGREKSIRAIEESMRKNKVIMMATQKDAREDDPEPEHIYRMGTVCSIIQMMKMPDGTVKVLVEGKRKAKITHYIPEESYFQVLVEYTVPEAADRVSVEALSRNVKGSFEKYVKLSKKLPSELLMTVSGIEDYEKLADTIAGHLPLKIEDKQELLETTSLAERLERIYSHLEGEIEILEVEKRIRGRVKKQMEKTQREFYLSEQMKAIKDELGHGDDEKTELAELEEKIKKKGMSKEATEKALRELKRLKMMAPMSAEATVSRTYIDWLIALPWTEKTDDKIDIDGAARILDEDHYGLEKAKERILEYLAIRKLVNKLKGPILCFVGPPGVGKTSLAKSIARALGRKFVRISLGGVRDEAEIRGHRRTYIGALPGKIIQFMKKAGTVNPVFLLDEVDKMSVDFRGDPSAALLEVLDPEQNNTFNDHYLDMDYDLSSVMFITTANTLHAIPPPLRDRMEIIRIPGYTEMEKFHIAKDHLIKKQLEENGLEKYDVTLTNPALMKVIRNYTREAGVRNLEREIASVFRKVAKEVATQEGLKGVKITAAKIRKFLGHERFRHGEKEEKGLVGIATGLAWTEFGGELLLVEVTIMPGKGKLTVTGKLGDVMQESSQAAISYVRSRTEQLGIDPEFYQKYDVHVHVPEGAIPKDGPSAGITMAVALTSALTKIPMKNDTAMTGEITLRGRVLPVGGLKEKLIAAHRAGIKKVLIPEENYSELEDVPLKIRKALEIKKVAHMDEVLGETLGIKRKEEDDADSPIVVPEGEKKEEGKEDPL
ncbi:MAG: endopeptidase La, partial [Deltaproteobacteria bacterium]|nr:endopeptidase La [Deltaproteobacteria bacterium]NIS76202.1 endopeptidase La [Deltaproteobacteria bacterium]